jgi:hypothetical protein
VRRRRRAEGGRAILGVAEPGLQPVALGVQVRDAAAQSGDLRRQRRIPPRSDRLAPQEQGPGSEDADIDLCGGRETGFGEAAQGCQQRRAGFLAAPAADGARAEQQLRRRGGQAGQGLARAVGPIVGKAEHHHQVIAPPRRGGVEGGDVFGLDLAAAQGPGQAFGPADLQHGRGAQFARQFVGGEDDGLGRQQVPVGPCAGNGPVRAPRHRARLATGRANANGIFAAPPPPTHQISHGAVPSPPNRLPNSAGGWPWA